MRMHVTMTQTIIQVLHMLCEALSENQPFEASASTAVRVDMIRVLLLLWST